ncbi:MAG: phosphopantothenate--cysteine ligase, partial [Tetragenococcus halophilus]|nr:phosphopantothenate--cysteine ligase [Tetragenococcus halophilus]
QEKKVPLTKEDLTQLTDRTEVDEKKISSDTEQLYLVLKKTPKVIQLIKKIQPETLLVGFKLLVDVSKQTLITTAQAGIGKNQADYILANDLAKIKDNQHIGYLIDKNGQIIGEKQTKESIAQLIFQTIDRHNT